MGDPLFCATLDGFLCGNNGTWLFFVIFRTHVMAMSALVLFIIYSFLNVKSSGTVGLMAGETRGCGSKGEFERRGRVGCGVVRFSNDP